MKVLVTGSKGMLAHDLIPILKETASVSAFDVDTLDITVRDEVHHTIRELSPDLVINCAAYTQVDKAEEERDKAFLVNGLGVQNLALICRERGVPLCHISTDYVFDGEKRNPYTPCDNPRPINVYGESKLWGEQYIQWITDRFYIIRTSWLYGKGGNNFVSTMLRLGKEELEVRVVKDQVGSPTSTVTLSRAVKGLIRTGAYGIYHVTDETEGGISWYDFALEILRRSGARATVTPITTGEFRRPARRPAYSVLDTLSFSLTTGVSLPPWKEALRGYLDQA